jgi:ribosomal subunit interface protein
MNISITARHCEISDDLRARAEEIARRLAALVSRPLEAAVIFDVESTQSTAEIRLHGSRGDDFRGTGTEKDHRSALDRAEEKVRRQIEKAGARRPRGAKDAV